MQNNKEIHVFFAKREVIVFNEPKEVYTKKVQDELKRNPNDIKLQIILIQILYKYDNDYILALKMIKNVLQIDQYDIDARLDLVEIMLDFEIGSKQDCQKIIDECYQIDNNYWRIYFNQIKLYDVLNLNDSFLALQMKQNLIKFPDNIWLQTYNLQIVSEQKNFQMKSEQLEALINSPYMDFDMLRRLAYILNNIEKNDEILFYLSKALKLNPNSYNCLNNIGFFYRTHLQNPQQCINYCYQALKWNPRSVTALQNIAYTYQNMKQYSLSNNYFKRCIEIGNLRESQYRNIVSNCFQLDDNEMGLYYTVKGLQVFPNCITLNQFNQDMIRLLSEDNNIQDLEQYEIISLKSINVPSYEIHLDEYENLSDALNEAYM